MTLTCFLVGCTQEDARKGSGPSTETARPQAASTQVPSPDPAAPHPAAAESAVAPARTQTEQAQAASRGGPLVEPGGGPTLVQLIDPLDEPEFYCVDVPGFGASLNLAAALSAHTCKPGADDELFRPGSPLPGNLQMPAYRLCLEAAAAEPAADLFLMDCSDSALQRFSLDADGSLWLADSNLCLAIAPGAGQATGGPSHVRRDLGLHDCETVPDQRRRWRLPGPNPA